MLFPCVATLVDASLNFHSLSVATLLRVQAENVVHWVVDTAPLVLGIAFAIAGRRQDLYLELNRNLERIIGRRTSALAAAKRQAEDALRVKSEFLAVMSHEIRTPLNGVVGMAQLLNESDLQGEPKVQVGMILESAEVLLKLLNDVLDLSKLEAYGLQLEHTEFDVQVLLSKVLATVQGPLPSRFH